MALKGPFVVHFEPSLDVSRVWFDAISLTKPFISSPTRQSEPSNRPRHPTAQVLPPPNLKLARRKKDRWAERERERERESYCRVLGVGCFLCARLSPTLGSLMGGLKQDQAPYRPGPTSTGELRLYQKKNP